MTSKWHAVRARRGGDWWTHGFPGSQGDAAEPVSRNPDLGLCTVGGGARWRTGRSREQGGRAVFWTEREGLPGAGTLHRYNARWTLRVAELPRPQDAPALACQQRPPPGRRVVPRARQLCPGLRTKQVIPRREGCWETVPGRH